MDSAFTFGRLARKLTDNAVTARYSARQTNEVIEESLHFWRDSQAKNFAVAIAEPQHANLDPLTTTLNTMRETLEDLENKANEAEGEARKVLSGHQPIHDDCMIVEKMLDQARFYTADAKNEAGNCHAMAVKLISQVDALGKPPV